jgi:hypothetical protein
MLDAVDPLLHRIEALPEHGCYSVTFLLDGNNERSVVMKVTNDSRDAKGSAEVVVPEANMLPGWSAADESFRAVLTAVRAVDQARHQVAGSNAVLRDVPGGWDVGIGNIVLDASGHPACVAHGELVPAPDGPPAAYVCPTCAGQALYGESRS